jgi:sulfur oxygenase/reductase
MQDDEDLPVIAINKLMMANSPEAFELMELAGPKMCMLTASEPGFLGYQANFQIGILPMAGRYGGGSLDMLQKLNPLPLWQYTVWDRASSHAGFHSGNFPRVFEICASCFPVTVEGPWEPIYRVVEAQMPLIRSPGQLAALAGTADAGGRVQRYASPQRVVAMGVHTVKPGEEAAFEQGVRATMAALSDTPGYLGHMVLEHIGVSPWGSLQFDPESTFEAMTTFGANPPSSPEARFDEEQARLTPTEYLVHSEWETAELASSGIARVLLDRRVRAIHDEGVVAHTIFGPYVMLFSPMMEQAGWREALGPLLAK